MDDEVMREVEEIVENFNDVIDEIEVNVDE